MSQEEAEAIMSAHYPDKGRSCLKENEIDEDGTDVEIIVANYNNGCYLKRCIQSIIKQQTNYQFHVTIVDDGSTDNSDDILHSYEPSSLMTIIRQDHQGVSSARNRALQLIHAHYVMFVDADDELPPTALETLLNQVYKHLETEWPDIVEGSIVGVNQEDGKHKHYVIHHHPDDKRASGYACGKLIRSHLMKHIGFPENYRYEDSIFSFLIFPIAQNMAFVSEVSYLYYQHSDSFSMNEYNNYATLDSYWVVKRLMSDIALYSDFPKGKESEIMTALLTSMKLSASRMNSLDISTSQAFFAGMTHFAQPICSNPPSDHRLYNLYKAVLHHDFTRYLLAAYLL